MYKDSFKRFSQLLQLKQYSANTINTYVGLLNAFNTFLGDSIEMERMEHPYLLRKISEHILQKNYVYTTKKQFLSAVKLYLREMYKIEADFDTIYPRKPQRVLPVILSKEEVSLIINKTTNEKHKAMLLLMYSTGMRSGELIDLKISNIDGNRNCFFIQQAKGRKDRIVPFPETLKEYLREYYKKYKPKTFLFEGQRGGKYTAGSLRAVFNKACKKAKITKHVTPHSLRHAYATHLLETGTNLKLIQELLGHNTIKTTLLYTQVSTINILKANSPIDFLKLD